MRGPDVEQGDPAAQVSALSAAAEVSAVQRYGAVAVRRQHILATNSIRIRPDQPITARIELRIGAETVPATGWRLAVRQLIAGTPESRELRPDGAGFLVELTPQEDTRPGYMLEADLIGIDQNAGLERLRQSLTLNVVLVPSLRLALDKLGPRPVGQPITMSAALVQGFGRTAVLTEPLELRIERAGDVVLNVPAMPGQQPGLYNFVFTPGLPGSYRLQLSPPPGLAVEPISREIDVVAVPELRLDHAGLPTNDQGYRLRSWRAVDWGIYELLGMRRSAQLELGGAVVRAGQPFTGTLSLALLGPSGVTLATTAARDGRVVLHSSVPSGTHELVTTVTGLFAPQIACCTATRSIQILHEPPPPGEVWAARLQLASSLVGVGLLFLLGRYLWLSQLGLVLLKNDRLIFNVDGQDRTIDLRNAQRWRHGLWPREVVLGRELLLQRVYRGQRRARTIQPLKVRQTGRRALEINGQTLVAADGQSGTTKVLKDGTAVRYTPSPKRLRQTGRRRPPSSRRGISRTHKPRR